MDFYHFATVRNLQLLFTCTHSHTAHLQILLSADSLCVLCACVCYDHLPLRCADKAPLCMLKGLFSVIVLRWPQLKVTCQSSTLPSVRLPFAACSPYRWVVLIFTSNQFTGTSLCVSREHLFWSNRVRGSILSWLNNTVYYCMKTTKTCELLLFIWGVWYCCHNGRVMKSTLSRWQSKAFVLNLADTHSSARIKVWCWSLHCWGDVLTI